MAYFVSQRTKELGIRIALGADRKQVLRMILRGSLTFSAVGALLGTAGSIALTRLLTQMLFQVNPVDPIILGAVTLFLVFVAISASLIPALRASRIDPLVAIRHE